MKISIDSIETHGLQARERTNEDTVHEYAEMMKSGIKFPAITVFSDDETQYYLGDGLHRVQACIEAAITMIEAEVLPGDRTEALWYATGANQEHGLRRTTADKRKAVTMCLQLKATLSDRAIAEHCGVHHATVASVRELLAPPPMTSEDPKPSVGEISQHSKRTGKDGRQYNAHKPQSIVDEVGREIPADLIPLWGRRHEGMALLKAISNLKGVLNKARDDGDLLFAECQLSTVTADLTKCYSGLAVVVPHAVCPGCQGKLPMRKDCRLCKGRGFVSEFRWKTMVAEETKGMIAKQVGGGK